jgi:hypothetical protein
MDIIKNNHLIRTRNIGQNTIFSYYQGYLYKFKDIHVFS